LIEELKEGFILYGDVHVWTFL